MCHKGVSLSLCGVILNYDSVRLNLRFWGDRNVYWILFDVKIRQNIIMACYYDKQTEKQLSFQLVVPTAYLEDDIAKLTEYGVLVGKNGYYQSNILCESGWFLPWKSVCLQLQ